MSDNLEQYDLVKMRTSVHEAQSAFARLKLRVQMGELIDRHKLMLAMSAMGHRHRDLLQSLPIRHAPIIAAERGLNARALLVTMDKLIHRELSEIAALARESQQNAAETGGQS
jgi:hypothetical protein